MAVFSTMMSWYFRKRLTSLENGIKNAGETQAAVMKRLLSDARDTEWGKQFDFRSIQSYNDFKERFPVQDYEH